MAQTAREFAAKKLVGRRLKAALEERGMTQTQLATAVGRPQGVVSDWVSGQRKIGFADTWRVAEALSLPLQTLFGPPRTTDERRQYKVDEGGYGPRSHAGY
jgi:transcriptional regulator with XRE-family HTH domain